MAVTRERRPSTAATSEVPFVPGFAVGGVITPEQYAARRDAVTALELQRCDIPDCACHPNTPPVFTRAISAWLSHKAASGRNPLEFRIYASATIYDYPLYPCYFLEAFATSDSFPTPMVRPDNHSIFRIPHPNLTYTLLICPSPHNPTTVEPTPRIQRYLSHELRSPPPCFLQVASKPRIQTEEALQDPLSSHPATRGPSIRRCCCAADAGSGGLSRLLPFVLSSRRSFHQRASSWELHSSTSIPCLRSRLSSPPHRRISGN